jgi:hypothetical protein
LRLPLQHGGELLGIGLVAGHVLLGEIEDAGCVLHLRGRHLVRLFEGVDLVYSDDAVGLGHLGAKRDHADGERHLVLGPILLLIAVDDVVPGRATKQRADRGPDRELGSSSCELLPNRHCRNPRTLLLRLEHKDF